MSFHEIWQLWCQTSDMCNLSRNARYVQNNGYFDGPLSLSLSSPLFRSLFHPSLRPSVSHFLHFSFSSTLLTSALVAHAHRLSTIPAFSWNYVEFMLHFCCIIIGTCAMHARKSHIYTDPRFTGQRPLNDRSRRINRSARFPRHRWENLREKHVQHAKLKIRNISLRFLREIRLIKNLIKFTCVLLIFCTSKCSFARLFGQTCNSTLVLYYQVLIFKKNTYKCTMHRMR